MGNHGFLLSSMVIRLEAKLFIGCTLVLYKELTCNRRSGMCNMKRTHLSGLVWFAFHKNRYIYTGYAEEPPLVLYKD